MRRLKFFVLLLLIIFCSPISSISQELSTFSPDGKLKATFLLNNGIPYYIITRDADVIIKPSRMGFRLQDKDPLCKNFSLVLSTKSTFDETWTQPWGEVKTIRNHYNELSVQLQQTNSAKQKLNIIFRIFNDGVGFRYHFPEQTQIDSFQIMDELTEFKLMNNNNVWWIPAYSDNRYEYLFTKSQINDIDTVHTPVTMETSDGLYLCIHEANLTDYASMTLFRSGKNTLGCDLVPWANGVKVKARAPFYTPWRTIQISDSPGGLITSCLVLNLNEPSKIEDTSWIKAGKYVGIWWGMHLGKYSWSSGRKHGATTENTKRYIDFAARHRFSRVLVEGWNLGWDGNWYENGDQFNFTTPYPDFDIRELAQYASNKNVELIGHHETGAGVANYERQLEEAFAFYDHLGIHTVKTGYVGKRADKTEWHHSQYMVRHYRNVVKTAAKYKIVLDVHEPIKDTGIRRTWPNMMTREGARGQEYNAWSLDGGNPPDYLTIIPFTRMLSGPFDYTPGIFDIYFDDYKPHNRVNHTLAKELATYIVIYSPLQMAADLIENYENQPAFNFITDVPVDWEKTLVIHARIGDYVTIARKDRHHNEWYVGSVTDENPRLLKAKLDFLESGQSYVAEIYADAADANWKDNPLAIEIFKKLVDKHTDILLKLAPGGGQAIRIRPATAEDFRLYKPY